MSKYHLDSKFNGNLFMEYWKKNHRHARNYWILSLNIRNICKGQAKSLKFTHKHANTIYYNRYKDHFSGSYYGQQVHLSYRYVFELIPCSIWEKYLKDKNFCEFWEWLKYISLFFYNSLIKQCCWKYEYSTDIMRFSRFKMLY